MNADRLLIVEDDDLIREVVAERLARQGMAVETAETIAEARDLVSRSPPDVALLDIKLPDGEGTTLLGELSQELDVPCVMMTAHATVESAVSALRMGASDYLEKPFSMERLEATLAHALERTRLRRQLRALQRQGSANVVIGSSEAMREVMSLVERVASTDAATVLVQGETGVGKGMIVRLLHDLSPRAQGPFIHVTCSALAESVMESELFGHERGAFTDAHALKRGLVEVAHEGTLFLDEVGELSLGVQGKLLRFLEEKAFRRVGGTKDLRVDTRVVAATNRDLRAEVDAGRFRRDLFYRLRVIPLELPPLRHRMSDIPDLVAFFVDRFNREFDRCVARVDDQVMELLTGYEWPGNVRELCNVIERAVLLTDGDMIEEASLPQEVRGEGVSVRVAGIELGPEGLDLESLEAELLREALRRAEGNRTEAGRLLGLSRHQVRNRLIKLGVDE
jgi:two-component system, NtrC family, response regulator AtoC